MHGPSQVYTIGVGLLMLLISTLSGCPTMRPAPPTGSVDVPCC
jgi:hypothetical protein